MTAGSSRQRAAAGERWRRASLPPGPDRGLHGASAAENEEQTVAVIAQRIILCERLEGCADHVRHAVGGTIAASHHSNSPRVDPQVRTVQWWPQRDSNPCLSHDHVFANTLQQ